MINNIYDMSNLIMGDITGDGKPDLIVQSGTWPLYFVFFNGQWNGGPGAARSCGTVNWPPTPAANGANGFTFGGIGGYTLNDYTYGDVDGDGINDLEIGDYTANSNAGAVYVIKGGKQPYPHSGAVTSADLTGPSGYGYVINGGTAGDEAGYGVLTGKFSNGTMSDMAISAPGASPGGVSGAGSIYVIWGSTTMPATLNLSTVQ